MERTILQFDSQELLQEANKYIELAAAKFGPRNTDWRLTGVLKDQPKPYTSLGDKTCEIWVGATNEEEAFLFQLTQECVHCISPHNPNTITRLEEGLTMVFGNEHSGYKPNPGEYLESFTRTKRLLEQYPEAIKNIRQHGGTISDISLTQLMAECPDYPQKDAEYLCDFFSYGRTDKELEAFRNRV